MTGKLLTEPFVAVFPSLVRALGSMEAAAVLQYIGFRQPRSGDPVELRVAEIAEGTAVSESSVKRHTRMLADLGVLHKHQPGRNQRVLYAVVKGHPLLGGHTEPLGDQSDPLSPSIEKEVKKTPPAAPAAGSPPVLALVASGDTTDPVLFAGFAPSSEVEKPEPEPIPTGADLFAAWVDGYRETHAGRDPDPAAFGRLKGQVRDIKNSRTDLGSWRTAWVAFKAAGKRGDTNVLRELLGTTYRPAAQTNPYAAVMAEYAAAGELDHLLGHRPAIGGTA